MLSVFFWKQAWVWFKNYWYWPVIIVLLLTTVVAGSGLRDKFFDLLFKQRESYEKELEILKREQATKEKKVEEVAKNHSEELKLIEEEHKIKGNGFGYSLFDDDSEYANTISARYYKDGSEILIDQTNLGKNPRKLTPRECARLQSFPEDFIVGQVSQAQIYKQFGNSVCVKVIEAVAKSMIEALEEGEQLLVNDQAIRA